MRRFPELVLFVVAACAAAPCAVTPAAADHLLQFESGRTIVVGDWHIEGDWLFLELPDGAGSLVVSRTLLFDARDLDAPVGQIAWRRPPLREELPVAPAAPARERARYEFARSVAERPEQRPRPETATATAQDSR